MIGNSPHNRGQTVSLRDKALDKLLRVKIGVSSYKFLGDSNVKLYNLFFFFWVGGGGDRNKNIQNQIMTTIHWREYNIQAPQIGANHSQKMLNNITFWPNLWL